MAEYHIRYGALELGAPSVKELEKLIDRLPEWLERLKPLAPAQAVAVKAPSVARSTQGAPDSALCFDPKKGGPNVAEYRRAMGGARFRMTDEESAEFGENRERAAYERLRKLGLEFVEIPGVTSGAIDKAPAPCNAQGEKIDLSDIALDDDDESGEE